MLRLLHLVCGRGPSRSWTGPLLDSLSTFVSAFLCLIVFGTIVGTTIPAIDGIRYGAFIIPGLVVSATSTQSLLDVSRRVLSSRLSGALFEILRTRTSFL
jgi:ABC-2 type transport system permease protein